MQAEWLHDCIAYIRVQCFLVLALACSAASWAIKRFRIKCPSCNFNRLRACATQPFGLGLCECGGEGWGGGEGGWRGGLCYLSEEGVTLSGPSHESISRLVVLLSLKGGCLAVTGARVLVVHEWTVGAGMGWQG